MWAERRAQHHHQPECKPTKCVCTSRGNLINLSAVFFSSSSLAHYRRCCFLEICSRRWKHNAFCTYDMNEFYSNFFVHFSFFLDLLSFYFFFFYFIYFSIIFIRLFWESLVAMQLQCARNKSKVSALVHLRWQANPATTHSTHTHTQPQKLN